MNTKCESCRFFRSEHGICVLRLLADTKFQVEPRQEKCEEYEENRGYPWTVKPI